MHRREARSLYPHHLLVLIIPSLRDGSHTPHAALSIPSHVRPGHNNARQTDPRTQPLAYARALPEYTERPVPPVHASQHGNDSSLRSGRVRHCLKEKRNNEPVPVPVHPPAEIGGVSVGRAADQEEQDQKEGLEVEEGGHVLFRGGC